MWTLLRTFFHRTAVHIYKVMKVFFLCVVCACCNRICVWNVILFVSHFCSPSRYFPLVIYESHDVQYTLCWPSEQDGTIALDPCGG